VKRFLFVISDTGGGHRASARAIQGEMNRLYGNAALVDIADIFVESERWPLRNFPRWYPTIIGLNSIPWGITYHLSDHPAVMRIASGLSWPYLGPAIKRFLQQHPADVIVSLHGIPNYVLVRAARQLQLRAPLVTVILDLVSVHAGWFAPGSYRYFVPTEEARQQGQRCGIASERIEVFGGMPVRHAFVNAQALPKAEAREQLGLPQETPIILMVGGGDGVGSLRAVVHTVAASHPQAYLVAVAGRNQELYGQLCSLKSPVPLHVEGFVTNMEVWMRAADILITKGGPNTLSEAFVVGLPTIIYSFLHGQEEGNVDYVVKNQAGIWTPKPEQAAQAVHMLLKDPEKRAAMASCARALVNPTATELLAQRLWAISTEAFANEV